MNRPVCPPTGVAFWAGPTLQARLVAVVITGVVTEKIIPGSTKLITAEAEVMFITGDPNLVLELSHGAVVFQNLPLTVWVDHARLHCFLDDLSIYTYKKKRHIMTSWL